MFLSAETPAMTHEAAEIAKLAERVEEAAWIDAACWLDANGFELAAAALTRRTRAILFEKGEQA